MPYHGIFDTYETTNHFLFCNRRSLSKQPSFIRGLHNSFEEWSPIQCTKLSRRGGHSKTLWVRRRNFYSQGSDSDDQADRRSKGGHRGTTAVRAWNGVRRASACYRTKERCHA